jgi:ubiquinone/menaquinone biosynthesis C-methylase UbiE
MFVTTETQEQRRRREDLRGLFDGIASRYDASRPGYPAEIVDAVCASARISRGAEVLEIGCGTGQLTRQLAGRGFQLTAIDIGAAMIEAARTNISDPLVRFEAHSFEEFAGDAPFDLIVSATAFHWVNPGIGLAKAARLLRRGGWLALLTTEERYPEPLRSQLRELWLRYGRRNARSDSQPAWVSALQASAAFGETVELLHARPLRLPARAVLGVERTRATFLSFSERDQEGFTADLSAGLAAGSDVDLIQETLLVMAPATS